MAQRIKTVQESDLRMLGSLARSIQRVLPVTQADIDAAAALGKGWVVTRVFEVSDPLNNLRGGTQLVIRQNSILPGQNVQRVLLVTGPGGQTVVIRGTDYIALPDAVANSLSYVKAFGGAELRSLPDGYQRVEYLESSGTQYIDTGYIPVTNSIRCEVRLTPTEILSHSDIVYFGNSSVGYYQSHKFFIWNNNNTKYSTVVAQANTDYDISFTLAPGQRVLTINETTLSDTTGAFVATNLFLIRPREGASFNGKIYYFKFWDGGDLVFDMIPVRRNSDNVLGMYDTVSGQFFTNAGTGDFIAGAPVDPILPDNYIRRQFIYMLDGSYIWTDIVPESGGKVEMDFQTTATAAQVASYLGAREPSSPAGNGLRLTHGSIATRPIIIYGFEEGGDYQATAGFSNDTRYKFTYDNGVATVYSGSTLVTSHTFTPNSTCTTPLVINGTATSTVSGNIEGIYLYSFRVWNAQRELVADYVPVVQKGTVPVVGFYDTVSGTFKTATAGTFAAGPEYTPASAPDTPMEIISNNGALRILKTATGSTTQAGTPTPASPIPLVSYQQNDLVLRAVGTYADSYSSSTQIVTRRVGVKIFDGTEDWNQRDAQSGNRVFQLLSAGSIVPYALVNNTPALCTHLEYKGTVSGISAVNSGGVGIYFYRSTDYPNARNVYIKVPQTIADTVAELQAWLAAQLANNSPVTLLYANATESTETVPAVYVEGTVETIEDTIGNTATAEMLLKVGDYQDVHEILSGAITRNIGVKALDGTENNWTKSNNSFANIDLFSDRAAGKILLLCTHFQYDQGSTSTIPNGCVGNALNSQNVYFRYDACSTVTDWTQWLAAQNSAGTPVIVVYPLATPTTESVAGQTLQVTDGDNVLEITQASLDNLELEAQYQAAVQLTIQEVEDANLDNNVEVTIS